MSIRDHAHRVASRRETGFNHDQRPPANLAERLDHLAQRVNCNSPGHMNPERFHAEKSDIALELRRIARSLRGDPMAMRLEDTRVWRP